MNLTRLAIVFSALGGLAAGASPAQSQTRAYVQLPAHTQKLSKVRPATPLQAVPPSSQECFSCGDCGPSRYTQYARPYPGCNFALKDTPYPKGPCCATLVGEFLCDVGCLIGGLFKCRHDVLGVGCCDECCGDPAYCADPIDCVPRFRDVCCGPKWGWGWGKWKQYPGPLWGSYENWPQYGFGGYMESEEYVPVEPDSRQPSPPAAAPAEQPSAEAPPDADTSTPMRSVLPPSAARRRRSPLQQSHYDPAPARRHAMSLRTYGASRAAFFGFPAPAPIGSNRPPARVSKPKAQSAPRIPAPMGPMPTARPMHFGEQFGKDLRPGYRHE